MRPVSQLSSIFIAPTTAGPHMSKWNRTCDKAVGVTKLAEEDDGKGGLLFQRLRTVPMTPPITLPVWMPIRTPMSKPAFFAFRAHVSYEQQTFRLSMAL